LTLLRASKLLVGFRNPDKQALSPTIGYEVGKLARAFCSSVPSLIRRGHANGSTNRRSTNAFRGNFIALASLVSRSTQRRLHAEDARFCFHLSPRAAWFSNQQSSTLFPREAGYGGEAELLMCEAVGLRGRWRRRQEMRCEGYCGAMQSALLTARSPALGYGHTHEEKHGYRGERVSAQLPATVDKAILCFAESMELGA
jgi:hypothetical protein